MLDWLNNMTPEQMKMLQFGLRTLAASKSNNPNSANAGWALSQGLEGLTADQQRELTNQREQQDRGMKQQYYDMMQQYLREKMEEAARTKQEPNPLSKSIENLPGASMFEMPFWNYM